MPLRAGTAYWATVSGVENVAGVPPAEPYRWEFTTEPGATIESTPAPEVRKYYFFGGQRLAMRKGGVVYYLAGDHLGSTSLTVDAGGNKASELRYKPYGEMRYSGLPGGTPTQYRFTGQRFDTYLNLYHMGARFYDPALSRWLSPDTLVPEAGEPQSFNRYSYVLGNSLRYTDPSGHQGVGPIAPPVPWSQPIDPATAEAMEEALAVGGPYIVGGAVVVGGTIVLGVAFYYASEWVINGPLGPDYPLPEEFDPANPFGATYPLPESSTLSINSNIFFAASGAIQSMADHLSFVFGYGPSGLPGFPNPFDRHDPQKSNDLKVNARHVRNALEGIQRNLGKMDLRSYLQQELNAEQFSGLTEALDNLILDLQNQGYFYEQFGSELSGDILRLLTEMGYIVP
ncbi:MAG: RHS repeat-associated core domain-containing protein [candidate division WOR-3 bacterium]